MLVPVRGALPVQPLHGAATTLQTGLMARVGLEAPGAPDRKMKESCNLAQPPFHPKLGVGGAGREEGECFP